MSAPEADIRRLRAASNHAIAARNAEQVVAYMAPDVCVEVAGGHTLRGPEASRLAFAEQFSERAFGGYVREPTRIVVSEPPVTATERGQWTGRWQTKSGPVEQRGSYTAEWRVSEMGWLITREVYRSTD
jgi:ketosteroid isomerase-like protein